MAEEYKNPEQGLIDAVDKAFTKEEPTPAEPAEEVKEEIVEEVVESISEEESPSEEEVPAVESESPTEEDTPEEQETSSKEEAIQEDTVISDWDVGEKDGKEPAEFDFKSLASEVGFEAESKDEFVNRINEIKAKAEAPDPTATLPENLKKAIEIANQDGDFLEYLGVTSVNYDAYTDLQLVSNNFAGIFTTNGVIDNDGLNDYVDGLTDAEIKVKGGEIRNQLKANQGQVTANIEAETTRNRAAADKELKKELDGFNEYRDFKYSPTHKKQLYDGITSGDMIAEMFHGEDGKLSQRKTLERYSEFKFGKQQLDFLRQRTTVEAKKDMLDRLSNKNIKPKAGGLPTPEKPEKEKTGQEKVAQELREQGGGLFDHMK